MAVFGPDNGERLVELCDDPNGRRGGWQRRREVAFEGIPTGNSDVSWIAAEIIVDLCHLGDL